jgi:hypothetical protein
MVNQRPWRWIAFAIAWLCACVIGSLVLTGLGMGDSAAPVIQTLSMSPYGFIVGAVAAATWFGACQYVVIRALVGRDSLTAISWIPATVAAVVAAVCFTAIWQTTVPRTLISISAIQASLPPGFPLVEVIIGLFVVPLAAFVGVIQGIVLSTIFARNVVGLWLFANLLAAVVLGTIQGMQSYEIANSSPWVSSQYVFVGILLSGILYAAVTGPALLAIAVHRSPLQASHPTSPGSPASA